MPDAGDQHRLLLEIPDECLQIETLMTNKKCPSTVPVPFLLQKGKSHVSG
jgi:hypothetical protein